MPSSGRTTRRVIVVCVLGLIAILSIMSATGAVALPLVGGGTPTGLNDLAAVGQGLGQTPAKVPTVRRVEPALVATP